MRRSTGAASRSLTLPAVPPITSRSWPAARASRDQSAPSFRRRQIRANGCRAKARRGRSRSDAEGGLGAVAGSWTIEAGKTAHATLDCPAGLTVSICGICSAGTARAHRAGLPEPEPGAGSAGPGAAQRCRLI